MHIYADNGSVVNQIDKQINYYASNAELNVKTPYLNLMDEYEADLFEEKLRFVKKVTNNLGSIINSKQTVSFRKLVILLLFYIKIDLDKFKSILAEDEITEVSNIYNIISCNFNDFKNRVLLDDGINSFLMILLRILIVFDNFDINKKIDIKLDRDIVSIKPIGVNISKEDYKNLIRVSNEARSEIEFLIRNHRNSNSNYEISLIDVKVIELEEQELPYINKEISFIASNLLIKQLVSPLYGDKPEFGARELLQNAIDACKEQMRYGGEYNPKVEISIINENEVSYIIIRDNGIGMTEDTLVNKFFRIGESSKDNEDNLSLQSGRFGIGILAGFLIGDILEVKTKSRESEYVYSFKTGLHSKNVDIYRLKEDFGPGTEIKIALSSSLSTLTPETILNKLRVDEWYLMNEIEVFSGMKDELRKIKSLKKDGLIWCKFYDDDNYYIEYLIDAESEEEEYNWRKKFRSKIICNGILIPSDYSVSSEYIKKDNLPTINVHDKRNTLKINLAREKIEGNLPFEFEFKKSIFDRSFSDLSKKITSGKIQVISDNTIIRSCFEFDYLVNIPVCFTSEGFGIYSKSTIHYLMNNGYTEIVFVNMRYSSYKSVQLSDFSKGKVYVFIDRWRDLDDKVWLSNLIESAKYNNYYIPINFIRKYLVEENSSSRGFRKSCIENLYYKTNNEKLISLLEGFSYYDITNFRNRHGELAEQVLEALPKYVDNFICKNQNMEGIYEKAFGFNSECVIYTQLLSSVYYFEGAFDEASYLDNMIFKY